VWPSFAILPYCDLAVHRLLWSWACACALLIGCAVGGQTADGCDMRIVMAFEHDPGNPPSSGFVTDIATGARVQLRFLRVVGAGLYAFELRSDGEGPECSAALQRLRRAQGVRSVDEDRQRRVK
jgi:hypothetical protein